MQLKQMAEERLTPGRRRKSPAAGAEHRGVRRELDIGSVLMDAQKM